MKCTHCSKKLALVDQVTGKCMCGFTYCSNHRLPEFHDCTHNYQKAYMDKANSNLLVVVAPKVSKI